MLGSASTTQPRMATVEMLEKFPAPVRRYLNYTGAIGKPIVRTVEAARSGRMRLGPSLPWLPLRAKEYYSVQPPGFVWDGTPQAGRVLVWRAPDMYLDDRGKSLVKAASALTVVRCAGEEIDQASMIRCLSAMIWIPSAFLWGNVSFEAVDEGSARVTFVTAAIPATGILSVDLDGRLGTPLHYKMEGNISGRPSWSLPWQNRT